MPSRWSGWRSRPSIPFFTRQKRIVREFAGIFDPEDIEDSIRVGGYAALLKALTRNDAAGGDPGNQHQRPARPRRRGIPDRPEMGTVAKAAGTPKYVVCNGDEGDPGAFMDRCVIEGDPHRVIEGMAIAAYAVGADQGYIYVRAEYPLAVKRLTKAINQANRWACWAGTSSGTQFSFDIEIRLGAGAFVCGEETALLASIEGERGLPRPRPPFPAELRPVRQADADQQRRDLRQHRADHHAGRRRGSRRIGTAKSKGTKIFALAGKVNEHRPDRSADGHHPARDHLRHRRRHPRRPASSRPCRPAGPPAAAFPEQLLDLPVDYESLATVGSIMGSGGMIVMDDTSNMVDVARFFMDFCMTESCGKCVPCRVGTYQMHEILRRIYAKRGRRRGPGAAARNCATWCGTPASAAWARRRRTRC